jgi:hypothetical protein
LSFFTKFLMIDKNFPWIILNFQVLFTHNNNYNNKILRSKLSQDKKYYKFFFYLKKIYIIKSRILDIIQVFSY